MVLHIVKPYITIQTLLKDMLLVPEQTLLMYLLTY